MALSTPPPREGPSRKDGSKGGNIPTQKKGGSRERVGQRSNAAGGTTEAPRTDADRGNLKTQPYTTRITHPRKTSQGGKRVISGDLNYTPVVVDLGEGLQPPVAKKILARGDVAWPTPGTQKHKAER